MSFRTFALVPLLFAFTAGCGHTVMRGTVVMKVNPTEAHVCLAENDVAVSDQVRLYRKFCQTQPRRPDVCRTETIATGTVTKLLNNHYAVVTLPAGVSFGEGDRVEKLVR